SLDLRLYDINCAVYQCLSSCFRSNVLIWLEFFFFSSRRRHTRSKRDWSSDVCSSDLFLRDSAHSVHTAGQNNAVPVNRGRRGERSEERRVGKECRSRWWAHHQKKKDTMNNVRALRGEMPYKASTDPPGEGQK